MYLHKSRVYSMIINNKKSISATKSIYKNNYKFHLSNSPQLKLVCPQTRINNLKKHKRLTKESRIEKF